LEISTIGGSITTIRNVGDLHLKGSGWKSISMIDVYNSVTFTLWLCGCNLKCPFCHNWRLAVNDPRYCHILNIEELLEELEASKILIDYLHVTGGEPLVQYRGLSKFFRIIKDNIGVKISLNTNFTLYNPLRKIIEEELVDHLATDVKIPYSLLYGYSEEIAVNLWNLFLKSIEYVADTNIPLELRIPVGKNIPIKTFEEYLDIILKKLEKHSNFYVIVQPLLGPPITTPRNIAWCKKYCDPDPRILDEIGSLIKSRGVDKVIVRKTLSFG
jgi:pyruvate formate lyase activating enzyme